jgi:hypothetical protein
MNSPTGAHSRKPRRSKNGTPEERAAKARPAAQIVDMRPDPIFHEIERHRKAWEAYTAVVDAEAENSGHLCQHLFLMSKVLVLTRPTTRRGLIAIADYLEKQFDKEADCAGCTFMADQIGGKLWPQVFLRTLRLALRAMAGEFHGVRETAVLHDLAEK